jgi:hypothetical protein
MNPASLLALVFGASWRTTVIGYLGMALIEVANALDILPAGQNGKYRAVWHIAAILVGAFGRAVKDGSVTGGTVPATQEAKDRLSASGFIGLPTLFALVMLLLGFVLALPARGDDPQFGTCWGTTCVGPRIAAPAMAVDLKSGDVTFGVVPGFGYGLEWRAFEKMPMDIAAFLNTYETANGVRLSPSVMLGIFRYVHLGPMVKIDGDQTRLYGLVTLGTDLGSVRP